MNSSIANIRKKYSLKNVEVVLLILVINLKLLFDVILHQEIFILNIMLYSLFLIMINYRRITWPFFIILFFIAISFINKSALVCVYVFTILYTLKTTKIKFFALTNFIIMFFLLLIIAYLIATKEIQVSTVAYTNLGDVRVRSDFGFGNCNRFAIFCYGLIINLYLLMWKNYKIMYLMILSVVGYLVSNYTDSRTFLLSCIVLLITSILQMLKWDKSTTYKYVILSLPFLLLIYTVVLPYYDTYGIFNAISSGRTFLYKNLLDSVSLKEILIGTPLINELTIDSTYLHLIFEGGILFLLTFLILYVYVLFKKYKLIYPYLPLVISILIYGAFETVFSNSSITGNILVWILLNNCKTTSINKKDNYENTLLH